LSGRNEYFLRRQRPLSHRGRPPARGGQDAHRGPARL